MATIHAAPSYVSLVSVVTDPPDRDFSRYDAYLDTIPVLYLTESQGRKATRSKQLEAPRQDIGDTRFEILENFGNFFAQGEFTGGAGQRYFHRPTRNETMFLKSEGFDITERGELTHLNDVAEAGAYSAPTALVRLDDKVFFANGNNVTRSDGAFPGTYTDEDPHNLEAATAALDLAASGDKLYAALGANGVHVRDAAGVWDHFQPDGATDLAIGSATRVAWLKDRLIAVGQGGTDIYEVVASSTPTSLETLAAGWTFESMFEAGPFILAVAVNTKIGQSRIHTYGLNSGATALEKKSSTPLPNGDIARCGRGYLGRIFIGGGRQNSSGGYDAFLYEAATNDTGELSLQLVQADDSAGASDLSVKDIEALPFAVVFGWSTSERSGLGIFHLGRNAFANHLNATTVAGAGAISSVLYFKGRTVFTHPNGLIYEKLGTPVATATLVSSVADWNTTTRKSWDLFEIRHSALAIGTSVELEYTTVDPDGNEWLPVLTSSTPGATGALERLSDVVARALAVKITSAASVTEGPVIQSYSVRSVLSPQDPDWQLTRTLRIFDRDRKDRRGEPVFCDPIDKKDSVEALLFQWVTLYEPDATFEAFIEAIAEVEPASVKTSETQGTPEGEGYFVELRMVGRRA